MKPFFLLAFTLLTIHAQANNAVATFYCKTEQFLTKDLQTVPYFEKSISSFRYLAPYGLATESCLQAVHSYCLKHFGVMDKVLDTNYEKPFLDPVGVRVVKCILTDNKNELIIHEDLQDEIRKQTFDFVQLQNFLKKNWNSFGVELSCAILSLLLIYFGTSAISAFFTFGTSLALEPLKAALLTACILALLSKYGFELPLSAQNTLLESSLKSVEVLESGQVKIIFTNGVNASQAFDRVSVEELYESLDSETQVAD